MTNLEEHIAGTDRLDPESYLRIDQLTPTGSATVWFNAVSNRTYSVLFTDSLVPPGGGTWSKLADVPARSTTEAQSVIDPEPTPTRFYRLVTPAAP